MREPISAGLVAVIVTPLTGGVCEGGASSQSVSWPTTMDGVDVGARGMVMTRSSPPSKPNASKAGNDEACV